MWGCVCACVCSEMSEVDRVSSSLTLCLFFEAESLAVPGACCLSPPSPQLSWIAVSKPQWGPAVSAASVLTLQACTA